MLKITVEKNTRSTTLRIEGRLVGPWVDELDRAWRGRTQGLGPATEVQVSCQRPAGRIVADTRITFANGALALRMVFEPSGQIAGLKIIPPEEPPTLPD